MPGYSIALARPEDLPAIPAIELAAAELLRGYAPESVLQGVTESGTLADAQKRGRLWVALSGEGPVGFVLVRMLSADLPHLEEIDVHPSHGRRGLGAALVRTVCDWAGRSGCSQVTLATFRTVAWNMPFYSRLGFHEIPFGSLRPELAAVVRRDAERGMAPGTRVVMSYRCQLSLNRELQRIGRAER